MAKKMTKREAISILRVIRGYYKDIDEQDAVVAVDMAIAALTSPDRRGQSVKGDVRS